MPIWARPRARRASGLTREAIVEAAVGLADSESLDAVSIRRVATVLGARTMSLYTYIDSKDDLLDLMADQIAGETLIHEELPDDWREAITLVVLRSREVGLRHPWLVDLANHRSHSVAGPNTLRHIDQSLAAVTGLKLDPQEAFRVVAAIDDYVLGYVTREVREREILRRTGVSGTEHLAAIRPYLQRLVESGEFANVAPLLRGDIKVAADDFQRGLRWMLDGIERDHA